VLVDVLGALDRRSGRLQARLDVTPATPHVVGEDEVAGRRRLREVDAPHQLVPGGGIQRIAGRVRAAVLHRLQHAGHVAADAMGAVAVLVDDSCDSAHVVLLAARAGVGGPVYGRTSRYSSRSQSVTAARYRSHSSRL